MTYLTGLYRLVILALAVSLATGDALVPGHQITRPIAVRTLPATLAIGINSHLATRYPDAATMPIPATIIADLGVEWVREDIHWHRIQPNPETWDCRRSNRSPQPHIICSP